MCKGRPPRDELYLELKVHKVDLSVEPLSVEPPWALHSVKNATLQKKKTKKNPIILDVYLPDIAEKSLLWML